MADNERKIAQKEMTRTHQAFMRALNDFMNDAQTITNLNTEDILACVAYYFGQTVACADCKAVESDGNERRKSELYDLFAINFQYHHDNHVKEHEKARATASKEATELLNKVCESHKR